MFDKPSQLPGGISFCRRETEHRPVYTIRFFRVNVDSKETYEWNRSGLYLDIASQ